MNRISGAFEGKKALIAFITGGDPNIETTENLVLAMEEAGVDIIEIGVPFSDPVAGGMAIQKADERALADGCTVDKLFEMVKRLRAKTNIPLLFMTYANPVFTYGTERFMAKCAESGIDGVIVPDLPFEEKDEFESECSRHNVCLISMVATASGERIDKIAREAAGFLYCVPSPGDARVKSGQSSRAADLIRHIKEISSVPCAVDFGISTPEQARDMAAVSDGIIVGSAIVELVAEYGKGSIEPVKRFAKEMKSVMCR